MNYSISVSVVFPFQTVCGRKPEGPHYDTPPVVVDKNRLYKLDLDFYCFGSLFDFNTLQVVFSTDHDSLLLSVILKELTSSDFFLYVVELPCILEIDLRLYFFFFESVCVKNFVVLFRLYRVYYYKLKLRYYYYINISSYMNKNPLCTNS